MDDSTFKLDENTLLVCSPNFLRGSSFDSSNQPLRASTTVDLSVPGNIYNMHQYSLAVSGDVFRWLVDFGNEFVLKRVSLHLCQSPHVTLANFF